MVLFAIHVLDANFDGVNLHMVRDTSEHAKRLEDLTSNGAHSISVHLDKTTAAHAHMLELSAKFERGEPTGTKRPRLYSPELWSLADADVQWLVDTTSSWYSYGEDNVEDAPEGKIGTFVEKPVDTKKNIWRGAGLVKLEETPEQETTIRVYAIVNSM